MTGTVYQLRVVLAGISPMVWRRLLVPPRPPSPACTRSCRRPSGGATSTLLPERTTPGLLLWEARYAALTSYGAAASLLSEAFPLGRTLQATAVRQQVERIATRLEDEFGEERFSFIDTCPADWEESTPAPPTGKRCPAPACPWSPP